MEGKKRTETIEKKGKLTTTRFPSPLFFLAKKKKDNSLAPMLSYLRSLTVVPPKTLDEMRPSAGQPPLALRCTRDGCTECAKFETEQQVSFEAALSASSILEWKCDKEDRKQIALQAGVGTLPSYILIPAHPGEIRVIQP